MEKSFITVNGLPAKLITLGDGIEAKPKKIILIIPGKFITSVIIKSFTKVDFKKIGRCKKC